jgi:hypothetical protein
VAVQEFSKEPDDSSYHILVIVGAPCLMPILGGASILYLEAFLLSNIVSLSPSRNNEMQNQVIPLISSAYIFLCRMKFG